ncbi:hypothetical protein PhCBS80983_g00811 [Powellomyces hirtus]|uniref:Histidine-specific methyltransferase SAM-dependent domain-containing protein n=1 Tax=Powellomyces hirtus TaxID=109895 RepID=A0A507ECT8_9FUNG|nr:hypothetical protein PhCBS80983_g00811 [Powellomyces hirtus]
MALKSNGASTPVSIIDLRGNTSVSNTEENLKSSIIKSITSKDVVYRNKSHETLVRSIPTMVLYDDKGLEIFDKITYVPDYYLTEAEIDVLKNHAVECVSKVARNGSVLVELGCGAMRKTKYILEAIVAQGLQNVRYYAVDLSESSLRESLLPLTEAFPTINFIGLLGCYEDSVQYIAKTIPTSTPKTYLWLGSSIGNLNRTEAAAFLKQICEKGMQIGDTFLCGIDRRNAPEVIGLAYNDTQGVTRDFIMNGLDHINTIFGYPVFDRTAFEYLSEYQESEGRHAAYYRSLRNQTVAFREGDSSVVNGTGQLKVALKKGEIINVEYSYKWSPREVDALVETAKLYNVGKWTDSRDMYDLHLFQKPPFFFEKKKATVSPIPALDEWEQLWKAWDVITTTMIPTSEHLSRPISLRHPYIFYLGHIPAFLDIQLARAEGSAFTAPEAYTEIFERGIDPDLDDPNVCNPHSSVPDQWPAIEDVQAYKDRVRERLRTVLVDYQNGREIGKRVKRVLWMCYEHEAMHLETLLYMLVQSPTTLAPAGVLEPISVRRQPVPSKMLRFTNCGRISTGLDDPESADLDDNSPAPHQYGWDNEKPSRQHPAPADFEIQSRMVTIAEYAAYLDAENGWHNDELIPASWGNMPEQASNGHTQSSAANGTSRTFGVKTAFGIRPLSQFPASPVSLSYNQAFKYACVKGMRLPTENELRKVRQEGRRLERHYGFGSWTPLGSLHEGASDDEPQAVVDEGLWEWTGSVFDRSEQDGYEKSDVYPGYSSDFL